MKNIKEMKKMKKYEVLKDVEHQAIMDPVYDDDGEIIECSVLYQIRALRDLPGVKAGDLGGLLSLKKPCPRMGNAGCTLMPSFSGNPESKATPK